MSEPIGYQSGIDAAINALIKIDPEHEVGYEKLRRTLKILARDHDAAIPPSDPPPPPPPPPPTTTFKKVAPRVAYKQGGSDARYCIVNQPGVYWDPNYFGGRWRDDVASYDDDGLCWGGRSDGPALTGALEINGRDYCSLPTFGDPTKNTGSWAI